MLRLFIVSAMIFITYFNLNLPKLYVDMLGFSLLFIIINLISSYNLFKKLIPPAFSSEEKKLYNRYFSRHFKANEYRRLLDAARRRVYKVNSTVINQGNEFNSILFVANVSSEEISVTLKSSGTITKSLNNNSWVGLVEYVDYISSKSQTDKEALVWGVDVDIKFNTNTITEEEKSSDSYSESVVQLNLNLSRISNDVVIYEWDLFVNLSFVI
jgi:hypothetical protein